MLLRHLRYFSALAREKHFAKAASACNVSQPTLSGAVAALEAELGVRLVVRGRRFLDLTPEGRLVLDGARDLLVTEDNLRRSLESLRGGLTGKLKIGVIPAAMPVVGLLIDPFCATHPGVSVEVRSLSSQAIQTDLDTFELDAGLTYLENEPLAHVLRYPLYLERYLFATGSDRAISQLSQITWRTAASQQLCLLSEDMQNRRILNTVFEMQGITITPSVVCNSFLAILSHLRTGNWSSIVPHTFAHLFGAQPGINLIPLTDPIHRQSIGLVTSNRNPAPPMASALAAFAQSLNVEDQLNQAARQ